jgi:hypothetical protein
MMSIEDVDFDFENSSIKIVALRNVQKLKLERLDLDHIEEGKELEVKYWIASKLITSGYANFQNDSLMTLTALYKVHWRETKLQKGRSVSSLPKYFYPHLRRYLNFLKDKTFTDATQSNEYNNALRLAQDVVNCRLKKLVSLSASPSQTEDVLQKLSKEERILYQKLHSYISEWKSKILKTGIHK